MRPSSMRMTRLANGNMRGSCVTTNTPRDGSLAISREHRHDRLAVFAVERGGRLVGQNRRSVADDRARDRDALLLAAAELARDRRLILCARPTMASASSALSAAVGRALAAHVQRQPDVVGRGQRRETDDTIERRSPHARAGAWPVPRAPRRRWSGRGPEPSRWSASACIRGWTAGWSCRCRTAPSASVSSPPVERQAHALERLHLRPHRCRGSCTTSTASITASVIARIPWRDRSASPSRWRRSPRRCT